MAKDKRFDKAGQPISLSSRRAKACAAPYSEQLAALHEVVRERERVDRMFYDARSNVADPERTFDRQGRSLGDRLRETADRYGVLSDSLNVDPRALAFHHPKKGEHEVVKDVDDVLARFSGNKRPWMRCHYCEDRQRFSNPQDAFYWFRSGHDCVGERGGDEWSDLLGPSLFNEIHWTDEELAYNPHLRRKDAA